MNQFLTAFRYSIKEQITNKFVFGLLIVFVPLWYWVLGIITPTNNVAFKFSATGTYLQASGHDLTLISAGLNLLTMILGFMFFHSVQRSLEFDKRLIRAGFNRLTFMLANTLTLLAVTAAVATYMVMMLVLFWHFPNNLLEVWLGFWLVSLTYGSLGRIMGLLLNSELPGFIFIVMFSMIDVFLQNPLGNPAANKPFLQFFPSYSAMQLSVAGGFTHLFVGRQVMLALCWYLGFFAIALTIFFYRTRRLSSVTDQALKLHREALAGEAAKIAYRP